MSLFSKLCESNLINRKGIIMKQGYIQRVLKNKNESTSIYSKSIHS